MPKAQINYATSVIYKIHCIDESVKDIYVGRTTNYKMRHQRATFTIIIKVFESQYALQNYKQARHKKRQLQQGRKALFNIITKSKSHT
jgi:hypothetical protein